MQLSQRLYGAADIMAKMMGGDYSFAPAWMGFVYGPAASGGGGPLANSPPSRAWAWSDILDAVASYPGGAGIVVSQVSKCASYATTDAALYSGNMVTLSALSDYSATPVAGRAVAGAGDNCYQIILMARTFRPGSITPIWVPYELGQLTAGGAGIPIASASDLAIDWTLEFS